MEAAPGIIAARGVIGGLISNNDPLLEFELREGSFRCHVTIQIAAVM
jgi:hypothetical protein